MHNFKNANLGLILLIRTNNSRKRNLFKFVQGKREEGRSCKIINIVEHRKKNVLNFRNKTSQVNRIPEVYELGCQQQY